MKGLLFSLCLLLVSSTAKADLKLVTCPEWDSAYKKYLQVPKRTVALEGKPTKEFLALYRSLAAILGSKQMSAQLNTDLEAAGYGELFDKLMNLQVRGGFPPDFIDALKRFHKVFKTDAETYVIDIGNQETLEKFRRSYCK